MQIIQVRLENGVFVPLEPLEMSESQEAVVILSEKKQQPASDVIDCRQEAREYFSKMFPELEIEEPILELVGIAARTCAGGNRKEYQRHIEAKYK